MRVDTGDTAWVLVAAALVMFMTPGLALFYGGLVRAKNVLGTVMQSLIALGVVTVLWVLVGYSLVFGSDYGLLAGGLEYVGLRGVGDAPMALAPSVPASPSPCRRKRWPVAMPAGILTVNLRCCSMVPAPLQSGHGLAITLPEPRH